MNARHQPSLGRVPGMYGVPLPDPRIGNEPLAFHNETLKKFILELLRVRYHQDRFELDCGDKEFRITPPRGKYSGIARIEIIYHHEIHTWRHVFAVTDSDEQGLQLWTEVRKYVRQS